MTRIDGVADMIFFECNADEELLKYLQVPRRLRKHAGTKPEVIKGVIKNKESLGVIDEDPGSARPGHMEFFRKKEKGEALFLYENVEGNQLVSLVPRLEDWIVNRAMVHGIDLPGIGLPRSGGKLHERLLEDAGKLRPLLEDLDERRDDELILLRGWVGRWSK